jgi:hypothetical protein
VPRGRRGEVAEAFEPGRVFALFGAQGVGVSTLARTLHEESETPTGLVTVGEDLEPDVTAARKGGAEIIFVDGIRDAEDVQTLYDLRLVAPGWGGGLIRVDRNAIVDREWPARLLVIEERIRALSMSYFVVHNDDAERAAIDIACRVGLLR